MSIDRRIIYCMKRKSDTHELIEQCILDALIQLLQKHPYDEITITDITNKAGVSRMAYYRNYESKDEKFAVIIKANLWSIIFQSYTKYMDLIIKEILTMNPDLDTSQNRMLFSYQLGGVTMLIKFVLENREDINLDEVADTVEKSFLVDESITHTWYRNI